MLTKEQFKELVEKKQKRDEYEHKLYELGIDIMAGGNYDDFIEYVFDIILSQCFDKEGVEMVYWWMYDDVDKYLYEPGTNGQKITNDLTTIDALYDWLVNNCPKPDNEDEPEEEVQPNPDWVDFLGAKLEEGDDVAIAIDGEKNLRSGIVKKVTGTRIQISYNAWECGYKNIKTVIFTTEKIIPESPQSVTFTYCGSKQLETVVKQ